MSVAPPLHHALSDPKSAQVKYRPVLQEPIPPMPDPSRVDYEYCLEWWSEQFRRCTEGWICPVDKVFINGIYYFYLNFVKVPILDELSGGHHRPMISPYFRDGDKEYFDRVWYSLPGTNKDGSRRNAKNVFVAKGRRKGWTTCELYGVTQWFFLFRQTFNISRAYPNDKIRNKERRLFTRCYNMTHEFFKRDTNDDVIDIMENNAEVVAQWTYEVNPVTGIPRKINMVNSINFYSVSKDGGGVRGDFLGLIVVVEAGMHTHLSTFFAAAEETLREGKNKFGILLVGGTSDAINNESEDYKNMFFKPDAFNGTSLFTPAWKCYGGCFDYFTGKSIRETSVTEILARRQLLESSGDYNALRLAIQENPLFAEEAFIPMGYSEYDAVKIDRQYMAIFRAKMDDEWAKGRLEWELDVYGKKTGRVYFEKDIRGHWLILEKYGVPNLNIKDLYVAGIDDVYKDKAPHSESKNCMLIWMKESVHIKGLSDLPVAFYLYRHNNRMLDYDEFVKGTLYYNAWVMYEHNESAGYIGYAREKEVHGRFLYNEGQIGVRLSDAIKADLTLMGLKFFDENRHQRILHTEIMESFKHWNTLINSDLASALHLCLLALKRTEKKGTAEVVETTAVSTVAEAPFRFGQLSQNPFQVMQETADFFKFGMSMN